MSVGFFGKKILEPIKTLFDDYAQEFISKLFKQGHGAMNYNGG